MTTSTDYPFRSGQLHRAGSLVKLPRVVIAAVLWLLVIEALQTAIRIDAVLKEKLKQEQDHVKAA